MTIIFIEDIEQAQHYAGLIHEYLLSNRINYNANSWQEFSGEPPYLLEMPDDIPDSIVINALR